jgi:hypothetical protein
MLVYATGGNKTFDGSATTTLSELIGNPSGVSLFAGEGSTATFDNAAVGTDKTITFDGYSLTGDNASDFTLAADCCSGSSVLTTTGTISAVVVPPVNPPVDETPPEDETPPVVVPPVVVPPPVVVTPVIQPTPPGKLPPLLVVPPLLTVLPPAKFPPIKVYVPPVAVYVPPVVVTPKPVVIPQPPVIYVPPVYPPKQDRN